jgi:integrase
MRGSIVKKGNSYYVVVDLPRQSSGKRKQKWLKAGNTKKEAEKKLIEVMSQIQMDTFTEPQKTTLAEYLRWWLKDCCKPRQSITTFESYERNVEKHIIPVLGSVRLSDLKPIQLKHFYSECMENGKSGTTVLYYHHIIHAALQQGIKLQIVKQNAADFVDPPAADEYEATILEDKQLWKLLTASYEKGIYIPVLLAITTGMRRGEILGLPWDDVNLEKGFLTVKQTLVTTNSGPQFKPPKSKSSRRRISLPKYTVEELSWHKKEQARNRLKLGKDYNNYDLVCCKANGDFYHPGTFSHNFSSLVNMADIPKVRFHDLRHSHASLLASQGMRGKDLQEHMGHASMAFTYKKYVQTYEDADQKAALIMDQVFDKTDAIHS